MLLLDRTLSTVEENVALDEALLDAAEEGDIEDELLRFWDATEPFIVLGRSSKAAKEVKTDLAIASNVPILRRCSGGATVVADRGCLFYAVLLSLEKRPQLRMIDRAHELVMSKLTAAIRHYHPKVTNDGICDIVVDDRKVSGNSLRVRRDWLLYHGTLLLDMRLDLIGKYSEHPPREPDYRESRSHDDFVGNLGIARNRLVDALGEQWGVEGAYVRPLPELDQLLTEKYRNDDWNFQR